jgi:excisionase family DNA binding protein
MAHPERVLTTGQVARICRVAPRTVSKWFDSGQLRGYRIPGSRDRRIPVAHLVRFMRKHGLPMGDLETGRTRVLIVDSQRELTDLIVRALDESGYFEARTAESAFEAGAVVEQFQPRVILADVDLPGIDGRTLSRYLASDSEMTDAQLVALSATLTAADREALLQEGFDETLAKPFDIRQLIETIDRCMTVSTA